MTKQYFFALCTVAVGILCTNLSAYATEDGAGDDMAKSQRCIGAQAPDITYTQSLQALPLMEGLHIIPEDEVLFLFGSNRIAQATAKGLVDIDSVYYYYQKALPPLGWMEITPRLYERGGERLHVNASSANKQGTTYVRFTIEPTGGR